MAETTADAPQAKKPAETAEKSPKDLHFDRLDAVKARLGAKGYTTEQWVEDDEEDEEDDDEAEDDENKVYTAEQISKLRHVLITENRAAALERAEKLVLGDQYGQGFAMFNTSFSNRLFRTVPAAITAISKKASAADRFDELYALTKSLFETDVWMNDYDDSAGLKKLLTALGGAWKKLLALSDEELVIDAEFTRPGVLALLQKFADLAECGPENAKFKYK